MTKLPPCHSRRELKVSDSEFFCAHPKVHAPRSLVRAEICRLCRFWAEPPPGNFRAFPPLPELRRSDRCRYLGGVLRLEECKGCRGSVKVKVFRCDNPLHGETTLRNCEQCTDYERLPPGTEDLLLRRPTSWAVGVTTAPREPRTLEHCLESLAAAGWEDPRVFAEPGVELGGRSSRLPISRRDKLLGAWPNWFLGLSELVLRDPSADAYLMVQDDTVFCRNVRGFLEQALWPSTRLGVVSLFCPQRYLQREVGFQRIEDCSDLWGALAYVFPNSAARSLLSHRLAIDHRLLGTVEGLRGIDTVVGQWAGDVGLGVYYFSPSLAQHIGNTSVVWPGAVNWGSRRAADFVGEGFDATELGRMVRRFDRPAG